MVDPHERPGQDEREQSDIQAEEELSVDHVRDLDPDEEDAEQVKGASTACVTANCNQ
jgi:hypothetical protein